MLSTTSVIVRSRLGDSKFADNYEIVAELTIHKNLMVEADFEYEYEGLNKEIGKRIRGLRVLEQIIAGVLLFLFLYRLLELKE